MNCARAGPILTTLNLDGILITRRDVMDYNVKEEADVELDRRYSGVGYHSSVVVLSIRLDRDIALDHV